MSKKFAFFFVLFAGVVTFVAAQAGPTWLDGYRPAADRLTKESQSSDFAWQRLAEVTDTFGPRI